MHQQNSWVIEKCYKFQHWVKVCQHFFFFSHAHTHSHTCKSLCLKKKEENRQTRRKGETKEEDNCHLVPGELLQSYPCRRQEVTHMLAKRKDTRGSLKETWDYMTPDHPEVPGLLLYICRYNRSYCTKYYSPQVRDIGPPCMVNKIGRQVFAALYSEGIM